MKLSNRKEVLGLLGEARGSTEQTRVALARKTAVGVAYQHGHHFLANRISRERDDVIGRKLDQMGLSHNGMRVALNRIGKFVAKVSAASYVSALEPSVSPGVRQYTAAALATAQTNEDAIRAMVKASGVLSSIRNAVTRRSIAGQWYVGLHLNRVGRDLNVRGRDVTIANDVMSSFDAGPSQFCLDPGNDSRELSEHEWVVYSDVWTYSKIMRAYPDISIDKEQLATMGQLTPIEQEFNQLLNNQIYQQYRQYSQSPAALVHTMYVKGDSGRFDQCFVIIEAGGRSEPTIIDNDGENPFGGNGMPFISLRGHRSGDGPIDLSDFDFLKQDQDLLNIAVTNEMRIVRKHAGFQVVVDRNFFKGAADDQEIARKMHNGTAGVIIGEENKNRGVRGPQFIVPPSPPSFLPEMQSRREQALQEQSFLTPASFGQTKSHVPDSTFQRALDEAGDVFGQRVEEDMTSYRALMELMLGTTIKLVKARNPSTIDILSREGFGNEEWKQIAAQDPSRPLGNVRVRESSARYRSATARKNEVDNLLTAGLITPVQYRSVLARDLDTPIAEVDRAAVVFAQKSVASVLAGGPFEPIAVSPETSAVIVSEFEQAMMDFQLRSENPEAYSMLQEAMIQQTQASVQFQMAGMMPDPSQQQAPAEPEPTAADAMSPADMLGMALQGQM